MDRRKKYILLSILFFSTLVATFYFRSRSRIQAVLPVPEIVHETVEVADTLTLLFVGDIMGHMPQVYAAKYDGGDSIYNFFPSYQYIQEYISSADLALANLEVTFGGTPFRGYPCFSCPHELAAGLKEAGFDFLFTANNHSADTGKNGLEKTLDHVAEAGFLYTGTFRDSAERASSYPLLVETNNIRIAYLNYTYDTNGMPVIKPNIVNLIDTVQIKADLEKARAMEPDFIITVMHWGYEYHSRESREQRILASFLAENGTDLIVGSHPHVVQPFNHVVTASGDSVPVIYSLGNFISNQRDRYKDGGIVFEVTLEKKEGVISILNMAYEPVWVNLYPDNGRNRYRLIPVNDYLNDPDKYSLTESQQRHAMLFYNDTKKLLDNLEYSGFYTPREDFFTEPD